MPGHTPAAPAGSGLQIRNCVKKYAATRALDEVSFDVAPGHVVGLVGPNGAGKTTLLHSLMGLVRLDGGTMTLDGQSVWSVAAKRRLAFMPDDLPRPMRLTGRELIELNARLYGRRPHAIDDLADRLEMSGKLDQALSSYSHGMRRKADLMAALLVEPDVLVLDEPFSGLDPGMVAGVQEIITELRRRGAAVLLSSHDLELVDSVADRIVMIDFGRVVFDGRSAELLQRVHTDDVRSAFLTMID